MAEISKITAYAEVFPSGQKLTAAILELTAGVAGEFSADAVSVKEQRVKRVYANDEPKPALDAGNGKYLIVEIDPTADNAATVNSGPPKHDRGPGGPPKDGPKKGRPDGPGPGQDGPGPGQGGGTKMVHKQPAVEVKIEKEIPTDDGMLKVSDWLRSSEAMQPIVDEFKQFMHGEIPYNLYIPRNYDPAKKYPLVLFMHDAEPSGTDPLLTLVQGIGAVRFASPQDQERTPAFVLAPELLPNLRPLEEDAPNCIASVVKPILDEVMSSYSVDENKVYTTGQSGGCMTSCELNHRFPDLFAASLLVAGQWDADRMRNTAHKKYWICVSEHDVQAFPGMTALVAALEEEGSTVYRYRCNAKAGKAELESLAADAAAKGTDIIFTVFEGDSVVPEGFPLNPISNHLSTWQIAYDIDAIRAWLLAQSK